MDQFILADESPAVLYQIVQDFKRLGAQLDLFLSAQQTAAPQVERELAKREYLVRQLLHLVMLGAQASRLHSVRQHTQWPFILAFTTDLFRAARSLQAGRLRSQPDVASFLEE